MASENNVDADQQDLVITRLVRAPRAALWQAWADPALLKEWWCPEPWTTEVRALDLRPGGAFHTFMRGPDAERCGQIPRQNKTSSVRAGDVGRTLNKTHGV